MKQRFLFLVISIIPLLTFGQGIKWTIGLSWEQVKQKAKSENKFIFIDCYATWCGPCKEMDRVIYPLEKIGQMFNNSFISIRMQADQRQDDAEYVKSWYEAAGSIIAKYRVAAYPTFLFFNPQGQLVHRASGAYNVEEFVRLATDALQQKGYTAFIDDFIKGQYQNLNLSELALSAKYAGEDSLAKVIGAAYIHSLGPNQLLTQNNLVLLSVLGEHDDNWVRETCMPEINEMDISQFANTIGIRFLLYAARDNSLAVTATNNWLNKLNDVQIFNKDTLDFLRQVAQNSTDKSFILLYNNTSRIDKIMGQKNWSLDALSNIISREEFAVPVYYPALKAIENGYANKNLTQPNWKKLNETILRKYGSDYARCLKYRLKINWYALTGNKKLYIENIVAEMDRTRGWNLHGLALNNYCMEVFRYGTNNKELRKALIWMRKLFKDKPNEMLNNAAGIDTYAILLYKAGRVNESIEWEQKAVKMDPGSSEIVDNLFKMKKGLPIWPEGFDIVN